MKCNSVAPPTVQPLRGSHQEDPRRSGTSAFSSSPTSSPSRPRLVASGASPMSGDTLVKILLRETLGLGRLPGDASGDAQPCRLHTGELFRSLQLPSMDIRLQSQVWNAFTVMRRTPKKAMLWSHLDCQGGLSVSESGWGLLMPQLRTRRILWPRARL